MIIQSDSLEFLKSIKDYENDIIYADPPYALGSEIIVRPDGKIDYKKASDFMNKWDMPTGEYWEHWFKEAYRTLKHGGYLLMFGMDRQLLLFKYYAHLAGFQEQQSIYWYYISNFPKATDLSKMIDKNAGAEREVIGKSNRHGGGIKGNETSYWVPEEIPNITKPSTELAKKYDGYKYSVAPLKQTCETIMVFKKPNKTGSVLHDTLAMENGDNTITCSALNIDGNRVGVNGGGTNCNNRDSSGKCLGHKNAGKTTSGETFHSFNYEGGRYPSQTFVDSQVAEKLDLQTKNEEGCSKILHKCDFTDDEHEEMLQLYQKYAIMKEKHKGDELWENVNIVETPLKTNEKELGSAQEVVQLSNQPKIETKNLQNYLSVFNVEWSSLITQQTELEKIVSVLKDVQHYLDLEKINQNVLYVVKNVINTQIDTVLTVAKTLITGIMESLESGQPLQLGKETKYMEDLIIDKVDFVIPMLSVLFAITKPEIDTTQTITFLKKYIMFVKVATQKYIEEISSCHDQTQYQTNNYDIYFYKSKVSKSERDAGLDTFEDLKFNSDVPIPQRAERPFNSIKNNHPTLKPIALNEKILRLFKTPNNQKICYPFAGAGSEIIGGIKAGFDNWTACELNQDYVNIANARIEYWTNNKDIYINNQPKVEMSKETKKDINIEKPRVKRLI